MDKEVDEETEIGPEAEMLSSGVSRGYSLLAAFRAVDAWSSPERLPSASEHWQSSHFPPCFCNSGWLCAAAFRFISPRRFHPIRAGPVRALPANLPATENGPGSTS